MRNRHIGRTFIEGNNRVDRVTHEVLAAARSAGRAARHSGRGFDRPQHDLEIAAVLDPRARRREGDSRARRLSADYRPLLLRHRHVDGKELYAPNFMHGKIITIEEQQAMARDLEADSLFYLPLDAIARCIRLPADRLCRACITGEYPTEAGERMYQLALRKHDDGGSDGRTYETGCGWRINLH